MGNLLKNILKITLILGAGIMLFNEVMLQLYENNILKNRIVLKFFVDKD